MGPHRRTLLWSIALLLVACGGEPDAPADAAGEEVFVEDLIVPQPTPDIPPPPRDRPAPEDDAADVDGPDAGPADLGAADVPPPDVDVAANADVPTLDLDPCAMDPFRADASAAPPRDVGAERVLTELGCAPGEVLCRGYCTDLSRSSWACGACDRRCPLNAACVAGACVCPEGTAACGDWCYDLRRERRHCGACGQACEGSQQCFDGACACAVGTTRCDPYCSRLDSYEGCGACGRVCPAAPNAWRTCLRGACAVLCREGYADCDGDPSNGCERPVSDDVDNCGACGHRCAVAVGEARCARGRCEVVRCPAGAADCDGDGENGCEERLDASVFHCGACDRSCLPGARCEAGVCVCPAGVARCAAAPPRAACSGGAAGCPARVASRPVCALGTCGIRCEPSSGNPYGDCDRDEATGCETILSSSAHCGRCGNACARGEGCVGGACVCPPGQSRCAGRCADPSRDRAHCGACGRACADDEDCADGACAVRRGARPISPLSTARATTRRPLLRWRLGRGYDGARVELCADRACARVLAAWEAPGESARPPADLPPGVAFWRLHARRVGGAFDPPGVTWELVVGPRAAAVDASHGGFADFNGDGLADFVHFRYDRDDRLYVAHVYHGAPEGLVPAPTPRLPGATGDLRRDEGPGSIAADFDGDGYTDLIAWETPPLDSANGRRAAYLHRGGPAGLTAARPRELTFRALDGFVPAILEDAGDVDGDGYVDLAASHEGGIERVYVYPGGPDGPRPVPMAMMSAQHGLYGGFGAGLGGAGDLNADGYGDLAVSETRAFGGLGFTHVFLGGPAGPAGVAAVVLPNPAPGRVQFSGDFLAPSDLDGDGRADLGVFVEEYYQNSRPWIVPGTPRGVERPATFEPLRVPIEVVRAARRAGDFDGDGLLDLLVGDPRHVASVPSGRLWVFPGASSCGRHFPYPVAAPVEVGGGFGAEVFVLGDVNGDGMDDAFVVSGERASLHLGARSGLSPRPSGLFGVLPSRP